MVLGVGFICSIGVEDIFVVFFHIGAESIIAEKP
jgi:hypothetical protein